MRIGIVVSRWCAFLCQRKPYVLLVFIGLLTIPAIGFVTQSQQHQDSASDGLLGPGDYRGNYDKKSYETRSQSVQDRKGKKADLYAILKNPGLGLPAVSTPPDNLPSKKKIALGRRLFYDRRLSLNNTMSCAVCHVPEMGFTNNEMRTAVGFQGKSTRRNAPTLLNVAYKKRLFFDAREDSLENQVWSPLLAGNEMANPSIGYVLNKIKSIPDYKGLFEDAFGEKPNLMNVGQALAQYQRALVSGGSRFDQWYFAKKKDALTAQEMTGFKLFTGKAQCSVCHLIGKETALFTDGLLHNTGLGFKAAVQGDKPVRVQIAPGVFTEIEAAAVSSVSNETQRNDLGLYEVTQNPNDRWKYLTPTLRDIELTAPYMHDGTLSTLQEVVDFYNQGGIQNENLSPLIRPLNLNAQESTALVAFLKSLTGKNVKVLVADAFTVPIGDLTREDPFWSHKQ